MGFLCGILVFWVGWNFGGVMWSEGYVDDYDVCRF